MQVSNDAARPGLQLVDDQEAPATSVEELAAAVGARDLLVLRQIAPGRFLQIGGAGRGAGWAGSIELALADEPDLRTALDQRRTVRWESPTARRILGPYHAAHAALVPVDHDVAVLFGSPEPLATDDDLGPAATAAVGLVGAVTPAKRLADELEVLSAVRAVMQCVPSDIPATLEHVVTAAADALGCEVGIAWLPDQDQLVVVERGWSVRAGEAELRAALTELRDSGVQLPLCTQDSVADPLPGVLGATAGVRSHYVLPLGAPATGLLVLLHTLVTPRGFTGLCRTIGLKVAEAGGVVVHGSVLREDLRQLVRQAEAVARRDPLTGLTNRLGWDEAVDDAAAALDPGSTVSLLVVDLNGLKLVNDAHGHEAGDRFLTLGADALRSVARRGDTVARLGGDEFGLLMPGVAEPAAEQVVQRVRDAITLAGTVGDTALAAAVGVATCSPGESLRQTWRRADAAMYVDKAGSRDCP